jgi:hypothetical protein
MRRMLVSVGLAALAVIAFAFLVPVIRYDTNVSPQCAMNRGPCLLKIDTPITGHAVYWSLTAYYVGVGAYSLSFTDYGFIS